MKKLLRALALSVVLAVGACSLEACGNGTVLALQTEAAGYDTIKSLADNTDKLCADGTLSHDKCVIAKHDIRLAKDKLDNGGDIVALVAKITGELH